MRDRAAVSLSFDDGRGDNTRIIDEILIPMGLPCTVNITTGYLDGTCPVEMLPSDKEPMAIDDVRRLYESGMVEIALHGDRHLNTVDDMMECRSKLISWLGLDESKVLGFASPGSGYEIERFRNDYDLYYDGKVAYMRTLQRVEDKELLRVFSRKADRILHWPVLYKVAYGQTIMLEKDGNIVYSIPVLKDITFNEVKAVLDLCIRRKGTLTLMFHSILDDVSEEDNWTWSRSRFKELCTYLKDSNVDVVKTCDLLR